MVNARSLFVGGTSSNAGKSWMATAICAYLRRTGVSVAPFKAQNMSNNSYPCRSGGEIGRAQVAQAEACGLEPEPAMNPILLKPNGNGASQVVVDGRVWKTLSARDYYAHADELRAKVLAPYESLSRRFDVVVIEATRQALVRRQECDRVESSRPRSGQSGARHAHSRPLAARRRHRARRCLQFCGWLRSFVERRGAVAVPRLCDQQVPWRCLAVRRRRADARGADESSLPGRVSVRDGSASRRRRQPRTADPADDSGAGRRDDRDCPLSTCVERDGLPSADVGRLDRRATP